MASPSLVWFRDDLRVADHPALAVAAERGEPIVALYVLDEESRGIRPLGEAAKWWLHASLLSLQAKLDELGGKLVLRRGAAADIVPALAEELDAGLVVWNRRYGGPERDVDTAIKSALREAGRVVHSMPGSLLIEPWEVSTGEDKPYRVYSPFFNALTERFKREPPRDPIAVPAKLTKPRGSAVPASDELDDWGLLPTRDWGEGLAEIWTPGEDAAHERMEQFLADDVSGYSDDRDFPGHDATSRLSPRLRWGELSSPQVWAAARGHTGKGASTFRNELAWRDFAWHTLFYSPDLHRVSWREEYEKFPWPRLKPSQLKAWQRGATGIPLVDAGMRQLWHHGWMHNRSRMVTASFLIKHLLIDWRHGEEWFWDTLVDADAANNPFNWQWVAGSGVDAAPYFRIFNPERQADKFDPEGAYVKLWVPEAGSDDYPDPIVDLKEGRERALAAWEQVRR
ncbi:cryptochrome/photolyase family protein [Amnibacterium flavum]|uniref:Deoxyribodipyrimidine photolyase n=1 Tax=Amnibacterium flavum TaxID=2173173 RepID=A0A2V1HWX9_9MICO|nr:deoxyribodipyrimidine photo-lyase [Amnibacterium flavum]PVZ94754.1 deoxyribodipyrimidine photolyase [Amnibacterium flavum]